MSRLAPSGGLHPEITLPHEQTWELYHNSFSLCSKKLRVCMVELALPYVSHPIDLIETGSYQNVDRDFLAVNPAGERLCARPSYQSAILDARCESIRRGMADRLAAKARSPSLRATLEA